MSDSLEQLQADAADVRDRGMAPDRIVLRAIALGCDTRRAIKDATGFDYAQIEKALEREAGSFRVDVVGGIERLVLAGAPPPTKASSFNPFTPAKNEHITKPGGRPLRDIDYEKVERLRAEGKSIGVIADVLAMSRITLSRRRKSDPLLEAALKRGQDSYANRNGQHKKERTVGYIEEPQPKTPPAAVTTDESRHLPDDKQAIANAPDVETFTDVIDEAAHQLMELSDWDGCSLREMLPEFESRREILRGLVKTVLEDANGH